MARFEMPIRMKEWSLWAIWCFIVCGGAMWLLVGSVAYWVKHGWLPADAAGWVQAIGSVLTLIVAVGVPLWQRLASQGDRLASEIEKRKAAYQQVRYLLAETRSLINDKTPNPTAWSPDEQCVRGIEEVIIRLNSVVAGVGDFELLDICFDLRELLRAFHRLVSPRDTFSVLNKRNLMAETLAILIRLSEGLSKI